MTATPSGSKLVAFWTILLLVPVLLCGLAVQAYYLYAYLSFPAGYCGTFAELDGDIGWVLKPATQSCITGTDPDTGTPAFKAPVFINADGARAGSPDTPTPSEGILVLGDSWSFGYGIAYEDTFAAQLAALQDQSTALFASPAYSGAQALLLGQRAAKIIHPTTIVYLELGFWERGVCTGRTRPTAILKPCYWVDPADPSISGYPAGTATLVTPPSGTVEAAARFGLRPGGMVGAGEMTLAYFLIARPVAKLKQALVRLGLISGFGDDFYAVVPDDQSRTIRKAHLQNLVTLAQQTGANLILIDPGGLYTEFLPPPVSAIPGHLFPGQYLGKSAWTRHITTQVQSLPADQVQVPGDNHYGPGIHRLIAEMIAKTIAGERGD